MALNEEELPTRERGIKPVCVHVNEFHIVSVGKIDFAVRSCEPESARSISVSHTFLTHDSCATT